jgi:Family of unknown function (DUF6011)
MKMPLKQFALAGNATFTARSVKTGVRFTFRVRQPKPTSPHFVSLMNGPDNTSSYEFLGTIFNEANYSHGRRSRITTDAPSAMAFSWIWTHLDQLDGKVEIFHAGKCCRCGRKLTTPESIEAGIGPECAGKLNWA